MSLGFGMRVWQRFGGLFVASQLLACSFIGEPPPGSAHELRPNADGYRCGRSFWLPVADTVSAAASATWIVRANNELEAHSQDSEGDIWRASRIAGWAGLGLFGASAIYGYIVEGRCATLRKEAEQAAAEPPASTRPGFPGSVYGFGFRMSVGDMAQLCLSKSGTWTHEGARASCKPKLESSANPEIRVTFELGVVSEIRTLYVGSAETKNRDYQALAAGLRKSYGPPQVEAAALSPECQTSLAQCLDAGVRPRGPVWHWAAGTIELSPSWQDERAVLDIRYTRADAQAQN
jgi:hypothetical protein